MTFAQTTCKLLLEISERGDAAVKLALAKAGMTSELTKLREMYPKVGRDKIVGLTDRIMALSVSGHH